MGTTKKQHYIPQKFIENFMCGQMIYEFNIEEKKSYNVSNISNTMCHNYLYEHKSLKKNSIENLLAKHYDTIINNVVNKIINDIDNNLINQVYIRENVKLFLAMYHRSISPLILFNNSNNFNKTVTEDSIEEMLSRMDGRYLNALTETVCKGYEIIVIKSVGSNFLLCDQFIATAALKMKNRFGSASNREIGMRDTIILVPLNIDYYLLFKNGNISDLNLVKDAINCLTEEETEIINRVIFYNSNIKVIGKKESTFLKLIENMEFKEHTMTTFKFESGYSQTYKVKKEIFLNDYEQRIYEDFCDVSLWYNLIEKKIGRNSLCFCDSGKKYKKCCMDWLERMKTAYRYIENDDKDHYRISNKLIIEKPISVSESIEIEWLNKIEKDKTKKDN